MGRAAGCYQGGSITATRVTAPQVEIYCLHVIGKSCGWSGFSRVLYQNDDSALTQMLPAPLVGFIT